MKGYTILQKMIFVPAVDTLRCDIIKSNIAFASQRVVHTDKPHSGLREKTVYYKRNNNMMSVRPMNN
jgi:hypothetical protein